jgi:hypothetical protein
MVKDLLVENIDGHVIHFCDEAARIAKPDEKDKHRPVVSVKIGDHCYHCYPFYLIPRNYE